MAKQFGLNQLRRNRAAINRHERAFAARRMRVHILRRQFLAAAALAPDQHRRAGRRHLDDLPSQSRDGGALSGQRGVAGGARWRQLGAQRSHAECMTKRVAQTLMIGRPGMVIGAMVGQQLAPRRLRRHGSRQYGDPVHGPLLLQKNADLGAAVFSL